MKKKGIISLATGLFITCYAFTFMFLLITRGGPRYPIDILGIAVGIVMSYGFYLLCLPLAILGVVFGVKVLKENKNKIIPWGGITLNIIGVVIFFLVIIYPKVTQYMKWKIYGDYYETSLREEKAIEGTTFPKGTKLGFDEKGLKTVKLIKPKELWGITFPKDTYIDFDKIDNYVSISLPSPLEIGGIKCSTEWPVVLFYGGKIWYATLAEDYEIQGITFSKGTIIYFKESGALDKVVLQSPHMIQGIPCIWDVRLYDTGSLKSTYLAEDTEIQDIFFPKETHIQFYESGGLKHGE